MMKVIPAMPLSLVVWTLALAGHIGVAGFHLPQPRRVASSGSCSIVATCTRTAPRDAADHRHTAYPYRRSPDRADVLIWCPALSMSAEFDDAPLTRRAAKGVGASSSSIASSLLAAVTLYAPLWTIISASAGISFPSRVGPTLGSLPAVRRSLTVLMLVMGLSVSPSDVSRAVLSPGVVLLNAACCFGLMPLLSVLVAAAVGCSAEQRAGVVLLGCVGGGQASNLFTLLAGGDVALSVVLTLSTTLLGVAATPALARRLLGRAVSAADGGAGAVFRSVASLVLAPLLGGLAARRIVPGDVVECRVAPLCPAVGVVATLLLVAGGSANSASSLVPGGVGGDASWASAAAASVMLPVAGAAAALGLSSLLCLPEPSKRALVVEVLSKSPTVAYVLARGHFGPGAEVVPAAAMVSLAVVGAVVASAWAALDRRRAVPVA